MSIRIRCDCGRRLTFADELAGSIAACPICQREHRLEVPAEKPKSAPVITRNRAGREIQEQTTLRSDTQAARSVFLTPLKHVAFLLRFSFFSAIVATILFGVLFGEMASAAPMRLARFFGAFVVLGAPLLGIASEFLSNILIDSNRRETRQERWIVLSFGSIVRAFLRGAATFLAGPALFLVLAAWYWAWCGEVDGLDRAILFELLCVSGGYWLLAVLMTSGRPLSGLWPQNVLGAGMRLGGRAFALSLLAGLVLSLVIWLTTLALEHSSRDENWATVRLMFVSVLAALSSSCVLLELTGLWAARVGIVLPSQSRSRKAPPAMPIPEPAPESAWMP